MTSNGFPDGASALTHILVVTDPQKSKQFYLDVLGAKLYSEYGTSVVLEFLGNWLLLVEGGKPTEDKPTIVFTAPKDPDSLDHSFTIRINDCASAYNDLLTRGAEFLTPPKDWGGEIRAFFRDPDGHLFEISEIPNRR